MSHLCGTKCKHKWEYDMTPNRKINGKWVRPRVCECCGLIHPNDREKPIKNGSRKKEAVHGD